MIVISDTTPLNYLILIGEQDVLPRLFERVIIPQGVWTELQAEGTPEPVRAWLDDTPGWLEVRRTTLTADASLAALDAGEQEAILLAQELRADVLLIDEKDGRREAARRSLNVVGTLGVLDVAAKRGLLDLPAALARLQQTSFRAAPALFRALLEGDAARKHPQRDVQAASQESDAETDADDRPE